jgi:AcrR family transcriptional regulator
MDRAVPYEQIGRSRQKGRTRAALVAATRDLLAEGVTPTVEQAADRAGISRTTAYRYFKNQRELLLATFPELESVSLLGDDPPADPAERLDLVLAHIGRQLIANETTLRAALRISLQVPTPPRDALLVRQGRAIRWIEDALAPLRERMGKAAVRRLALAIRACFGIEPLVWLTDIGGLSRRAALELMHGSARAVLHAAASVHSTRRSMPSSPSR